MKFDNDLVAGKLRRWEKYLEDYKLPCWSEIPNIGLYMEQVIILLREYLDYLPPELKDEQMIITAATINNYVRTKIMPEPVKKKYYRVHIAYLVMICTMKQILPIAVISRIIPMDIPESEVERIYGNYSDRHRSTVQYFLKQIRLVAGPILDHAIIEESVKDTEDLITMCTIYAGFSKLMAEKLLLLDGKDLSNGGSIEIRKR